MNDAAVMLDDMMKKPGIKELIALPEPVFNVAMERLRRAHLEAKGYRFMDPSMPGCESCEG